MNIVKAIWFVMLLNLLVQKLAAQELFNRIDTLGNFGLRFESEGTHGSPGDTSGLLFLTGELHGVASNPLSEFYSLKYFVRYCNVKAILLESGYTNSYLLNNFLKTGDQDFLTLYLSDYPSKYVEVRDALLLTKSFYDSLPAANKFCYISVDIVENENQPFGFNLLNLLAVKSVHDSLLKSDLTALNLQDSFPAHIETYEAILKKYNPITDFDPALVEIIGSYKNWSATKQNLFKQRDHYLYLNTLSSLSLVKTGNIYGQFGYGHIDLTQKSMAYFLNNDTLFRNKVFCIYPFYRNCNSSFFELKKNEGFNLLHFKYSLNRMDLTKGIYLTQHHQKYYYIHTGYKEMQELAR